MFSAASNGRPGTDTSTGTPSVRSGIPVRAADRGGVGTVGGTCSGADPLAPSVPTPAAAVSVIRRAGRRLPRSGAVPSGTPAVGGSALRGAPSPPRVRASAVPARGCVVG
ncbi:hypothetical protein GCM10009753_03240 [Streptantibioticus ferralitis]